MNEALFTPSEIFQDNTKEGNFQKNKIEFCVSLFENNPDSIAAFSFQQELLYANKSFRAHFSYFESQGHISIDNLISDCTELDSWKKSFNLINNGEDLVSIPTQSHDYTWKLLIFNKDSSNAVIIAYGRKKINDTKFEQALQESKDRFRAQYQHLPVPTFTWQKSTTEMDFNLIDYNIAGEELTKGAVKKLLGFKASQFFNEYDGVFQDMINCFQEKNSLQRELKYIFKLINETKYLKFTYAFVGPDLVMVHSEDITEQKRAFTRIAEERERLMVTLRSIGDAVITTDIKGNVTLLNPVAEKLCGWKSREAQNKPLLEVFNIINEQTREKCSNPVESVIASRQVVGLANHTILISRDGTERVISDSAAPILNENKELLGVVLVFRDNTDKQKLEQNLINAQRLESLGVLAGGIAHDFNNLLSGLFGYVEICKEYALNNDNANVIESLTRAVSVYNRARDLTRQLLTFSKGGVPQKKLCSIKEIITTAVQFVLSGSNVKPAFDFSSDLWPCEIDENQFSQVIDNIVLNAREAMPLGGTVNIRVKNQAKIILPEISQIESNYVAIDIEDNGIGISKGLVNRIFDPFFTTKQKGSGLGLATVYSIVKKHDGHIRVESEIGKGTCFTIFVPAAPTPTKEITLEKDNSQPTGKGCALILDDEEYIIDIAKKMLLSIGYNCEAATNYQTAIKLYEHALKLNQPFHFVLLDLTIPGGFGGREAIETLKKINPDLKAIAMSGYSEDPIIADPQRYGFVASLQKPFRKNDLANALVKLGL